MGRSKQRRLAKEAAKQADPNWERERVFREVYNDLFPQNAHIADKVAFEVIESNVIGRYKSVQMILDKAVLGDNSNINVENFDPNFSHRVREWQIFWELNQHSDPKRQSANSRYKDYPNLLEYFKAKSFISWVRKKGKKGLVIDKDNVILSDFLDCLKD